MTTTDSTTETTDQTDAPEGTESPAIDEVSEGQEAEEKPNGNAEAAKYRRALRAAEKERDALAQRLGTMQTAEAERIAATHLADGSDLWSHVPDLSALLDDDGNLDHDRVKGTALELLKAKPHWGRQHPKASKLGSGAAARPQSDGVGWSSVLKRSGGQD